MLVGDVIEDGIYVLDLAKPEASSRDSFPMYVIGSSLNLFKIYYFSLALMSGEMLIRFG